MKRFWLGVIVIGCVVGCQSVEPPKSAEAEPQSTVTDSAPETTGVRVTPMTPSPIPNAPVTGSESLQGGGSAVGNVAKDRARSAAQSASQGSLDQLGSGEE